MNAPQDVEPAGRPTAGKLRFWPAGLIVAAAGITAGILWIPGFMDQAQRNLATQILALLAALGLGAWLLLFSRLSVRVRRRAALFLAGLLAALAATVRLEGLSGDLWFDFGWRWRPHNTASAAASPVSPHGTADLSAVTPRDYPQYLGPNRDATLPAAALQRDWTAHPPRELWRREIGAGWSAFSVVGDFAVTQEQRGADESVSCLELASGKTVWSYADPEAEPRVDDVVGGDGPRATPTIHGGRVYALGASGVLNCLDGASGQRVWSRKIEVDALGERPHWGYSGSPLVVDDLVLVIAGGPGKSLLAYRASDGSLAWSAGTDRAAYASPMLMTLAGVRQIVCMNKTSVTSHDPADGKLLWMYDWNHDEQNCASPLAVDDARVLVSSGYGFGSGLVEIQSAGDGALQTQEVWRNRELKSKFANMLFYDGHIYGLDDGIFTCLVAETGQRKWKKGRYGHGQLLLAGGLIVVQTEAGDVVLVEPSPQKLIELGRIAALSDKTWNNPALALPYLLVRNAREAACYELPLAASAP